MLSLFVLLLPLFLLMLLILLMLLLPLFLLMLSSSHYVRINTNRKLFLPNGMQHIHGARVDSSSQRDVPLRRAVSPL